MEMGELLRLSISKKASDLHLQPNLPPLLRIDGAIAPIKDFEKLSSDDIKRLLYTLMTEDQQQQFEAKLVLEMGLNVPSIGNFRVSVFHQSRGVAAVFRVIPEHVPTFEEISLPSILKNFMGLQHGLILVSGPIGSGKSTTLAAMIDYINSAQSANIITIEDPIEFVYQNKKSIFNQLQVGRDTPDFATALRAALRQDPNVILLGELRDLETMRLALTAAETGHLVLATIHASSAPLAISRFVDVFSSEEKNRVRSLLSETLQLVLGQTLIKKISGGRTAAFEILVITQSIRHFIRQDMIAHMESTMQTSSDKGMCTMEMYLQKLVEKQVISPTVANSVALQRGAFRDAEGRDRK